MNTITIVIGIIVLIVAGIVLGIFAGEVSVRISNWRTKKKFIEEYTIHNDLSRKREEGGSTRTDGSGEPDKFPLSPSGESGIREYIPIPSDVVTLPEEDSNSTGKTSTSSRGFFGLFKRRKE